MISSNKTPFLPPLAFRVGVSGARDLSGAPLEKLKHQVEAFFCILTDELQKAANTSASFYAAPAHGRTYDLRMVSPLAEGVDRLVAEVSTKFFAELYAPLPFSQSEYETDFVASKEHFRSMIAKAKVLELDGAHDVADESYLEVGQYVVRNCDLLIAIWDGQKPKGRGGTAEIVEFAVQSGVPVWLIDATGGRLPQLITHTFELRQRDRAPTGERAETQLREALAILLVPPDPRHQGECGIFAYLSDLWRGDGEISPLKEFFAERPRRNLLCWRAFAWMMNLFAPAAPKAPAPPPEGASEVRIWWRQLYGTADYYSIAYGDRYRSSYVLIAFLAVLGLALACLAGELPLPRHKDAVMAEIVVFVLIFALALFAHRRRWHEKWISYRLLAELCRKQYVLAGLGRCLPGVDVTRLTTEAYEDEEPHQLPPDAWVAWYYSAVLRAAPPLEGNMDLLKQDALDEGHALITEQLRYHLERQARNHRIGERLAIFGEVFFFAALLIGLFKILVLTRDAEEAAHRLTAVGIIISAVSAAFVGIRAYSEFSLLSRQSAHMRRVLTEATTELDAVALNEPLSSRELGRCLFSLTTAMMQDIGNWAQLFRVKVVEVG